MKRVNKKDKDSILMTKKKTVTLTEEQLRGILNNPTKSDVEIRIPTKNMHPTAEQRKDLKNVSKEEFIRFVRKCGSSGHIGVSRHWVDKKVKVTMEEILD